MTADDLETYLKSNWRKVVNVVRGRYYLAPGASDANAAIVGGRIPLGPDRRKLALQRDPIRTWGAGWNSNKMIPVSAMKLLQTRPEFMARVNQVRAAWDNMQPYPALAQRAPAPEPEERKAPEETKEPGKT